MRITGRHRDRLVSRQGLDFLDRGTHHWKPAAKCVPVFVPGESGDLRLGERAPEPSQAAVGVAVEGKYKISGFVRNLRLLVLKSFRPDGVQMNVSCAAIFRLCQPNDLPPHVDLAPVEGELFAPEHLR